jgi:hypothetical protein
VRAFYGGAKQLIHERQAGSHAGVLKLLDGQERSGLLRRGGGRSLYPLWLLLKLLLLSLLLLLKLLLLKPLLLKLLLLKLLLLKLLLLNLLLLDLPLLQRLLLLRVGIEGHAQDSDGDGGAKNEGAETIRHGFFLVMTKGMQAPCAVLKAPASRIITHLKEENSCAGLIYF